MSSACSLTSAEKLPIYLRDAFAGVHLNTWVLTCRAETSGYAERRSDDILAAATAVPRLRKEIELLTQEASSLESKRQEASAKAMQTILERDQVPAFLLAFVGKSLKMYEVRHADWNMLVPWKPPYPPDVCFVSLVICCCLQI